MAPTSLFQALQADQNRDVAWKLKAASVCMGVLPVGTFYLVKALHAGSASADMWGGFAAVVVANIVVVCYVVMAFNEEDPDGPQPKPPPVGIWAVKKTD
jgi:hypothetical protein